MLARWILFLLLSREKALILDADFEHAFRIAVEDRGRMKALFWFWAQLFISIPPILIRTFLWRMIMLRNYLHIAIRNFRKQKLYSTINVVGLAIGMAACLLIFFWVQDELSFDRFHSNAGRIYRLERYMKFQGSEGQIPITGGPFGPALIADYPEIEDAVRLERDELQIQDIRQITRRQEVIFTDPSIFSVFDFELEEGDPATALSRPLSVVLTRERARALMGKEDVMGQSFTAEWNNRSFDFRITGILKDVPRNSHVQFNMLVSNASQSDERYGVWVSNFLYTYVLVREDANLDALYSKFPEFILKYMGNIVAQLLGPEADINEIMKLRLVPLPDIHLHPSEEFEIEPQGSITSIYIFSASALLILIVACINFMNLSTARARQRAREVGMRKTSGAHRHQLWGQFLGESVFLSCMSLCLAVILILILLPFFNHLSGKTLEGSLLYSSGNWIYLLAITMITGLLAGIYPAFVLTAFEPAVVLKGGTSPGAGKSLFRRTAAVFQFVISIALIVCTLTIYRQLVFVQNMNLGFNKDNVLIIEANSRRVGDNIDAFRNSLLENTQIRNVSSSSNFPGSGITSDTMFRFEGSDELINLYYLPVDHDFIQTYGMEVLRGRPFSREFATDVNGAVILNETAVMKLESSVESTIGKKLEVIVDLDLDHMHEFRIVGIVRDFHFKSLHQTIEPMVMACLPHLVGYVSARIAPEDVMRTIHFIQDQWAKHFPGEDFEYRFLDDRIDAFYHGEKRLQTLLLSFSILSIFVASLGLFGLAAFTAEERTKEIGIRRVLGASTSRLLFLMSNEFTKWILAANLLAWPAAWFLMKRWLQNFAYRMNLGVGIFLISAVFTLFVALITVSFQIGKAAKANPAKTLRYE